GTTTTFSTGDKIMPMQANFGVGKDSKKIATTPVGSYPANSWGLCDMHGNVAEWCHDWHGPYEAGAQTDPVGRETGYARVVRGWSFLPTSVAKKHYGRSASRCGHLPQDANDCTGFRVVLGEMPATKPLPPIVAEYQNNVLQKAADLKGPDPAKPYFVNYTA